MSLVEVRQSGPNVEISVNGGSYSTITWPYSIAANTEVRLTTDITLTATNQVFVVNGANVDFNGNRRVATVANVANYRG